MSLTPDKQLEMLHAMQTIRRFEERASDDFQAGQIYGVVHCYIGQEAVAVGAISALNPDDHVISTYRDHGHYLARGGDPLDAEGALFHHSLSAYGHFRVQHQR